jgi:hypothetical protein
MSMLVAAGMAVLAAVMFAVAAVTQNGTIAAVVRTADPATPAVVGGDELGVLARSRAWLAGTSLTAVASIVHAAALVLARWRFA